MDRDGVLNVDRVDYVYRMQEFIIPEGVVESLQALKAAGYLLIVITNQSGIAKGIYKREDVQLIHNALQEASGGMLDDLYFCPYHEKYDSASLTRKPGSLLIEKAAAKYEVDMIASWMVATTSATSLRAPAQDCEPSDWPQQAPKQMRHIWWTTSGPPPN